MNKYYMQWAEFNPAVPYVVALKWTGWNCIRHGGNYCVLLFPSAKTEIFAFIMVILSETNEEFHTHSKIFLSNFSYFELYSYAVLFNPFQVIWIWLVKSKSSKQRTILGLPLLLTSSSWEYLMFLNTFVQKHINSKYTVAMLGFFFLIFFSL